MNQWGAHYLPRLQPAFYQGDAVVHWTLSMHEKGTGWLGNAFHARCRELLLHAAAREGLFCPTYCLMPDHIHLLWMGLRADSDQRNGMAFLRRYLEPPWRQVDSNGRRMTMFLARRNGGGMLSPELAPIF